MLRRQCSADSQCSAELPSGIARTLREPMVNVVVSVLNSLSHETEPPDVDPPERIGVPSLRWTLVRYGFVGTFARL